MSNTNPTIVQASLDDKELQASINKMVANFDKGLQTMLEHSNEYVGKIQTSLQKIGDTNFGAKGSNDGAVIKQTKAQNDFTDAVKRSTNEIKRQGKEGEMSFDQIAAALSKARQTVSEFNTKRASGILPSSEDYKRYEQSLARIVEYNDKLKQSALSRADANQWANVFDARRNVKDLFSTDERLKQLNKYYAEQEKLSQKATQDEERQRQKRVAAMEKESAAQKKMIDDQYKLSFARTMKIPTDQLDLAQAKLERLQALLRDMRERGILSNTQIASTEAEIRKLEQIIGQANTAQQQTTQSAQRYTEQTEKGNRALQEQKEHLERIKDIASQARKDIGQYGFANITNYRGVVYAENDERAKGLTIEQQIEKIIQEENAARNAQLGTEKQITQEIEQRGKKYVSPNTEINTAFNRMVANKIGLSEQDINNTSTKISALTQYIKQLEQAWSKMTDAEKNSPFGRQLRQELQYTTRLVQQARTELTRPINLKNALSGSEKTLDDIAYKMQRLRAYKQGIDLTKPNATNEIKQVDEALAKLQKDADKWMGKSQQMIKINTALGRSWNYMKNRLAFYFTVGVSTSFVKNLIEVRSQYEMNERALGILINSAERGTQIFNELSQMALVSPYTLIELSAAAKQLTAYDIAAKDVVNTTRRLADMAAAVGIPIERLTYALGQIKAYGYLNARDARMFANAGIPLVKNLSEYYTELEGRLVSTADIYDRIKKKQIGYEEVMSTISKMTDEGGKFYDFQAKMAETLKVQLANLTLAWNNMLNAMGEESQGVLVAGIGTLKQVFLHWKDIEHVLYELVVALGAYKAYQIITTRLMGATAASLDSQVLAMKRNKAAMLGKQALTRKLTADELRQVAAQNQVTAADYRNALSGKQLTKQKALLLVALNKNNVQLKAAVVNMGLLTTQEVANITAGKALAIVFKSIGISIRSAALAAKAFMASMWPLLVVGAIYELYHAWDSYGEHVKEVNKQAAEHAKEAFESIKQYLESESTINTRQRVVYKEGNPLTDAESQKAWDEMREKIELSSSASNTFVARLMQIDDINHRLAAGFDYLRNVQRVAGVMQTLKEDAVNVSSTALGGLFGEGLKDDLTDFINAYQKYVSLNENLRQSYVGEEYFNDQKRALEEFRGEVEKTTTSLYNIASKEGFNTNEQREFFEREISEIAQAEQMGAKETRIFRMQAEKEYYAYARAQLVAQLEYQQGAQKAATEARIKDLDNEFGTNKALQESFFTWLTEKQDHAVKNMLRGKTQEEIKQGEWLKGSNAKWVEEMARKFSKEYGVSFNDLHRLVLNANTWSINIPVFFQTIGQPLSDVQRDYEARTGKKFKDNPIIKDAKSQVEILDILKKKQKEVANEMATAEKAGGKYWEDNKQRYKEENDALVADIHAYNALTDAEEKANKKNNKDSKKDPLLDALKQEISLVEKLQNDYDKLSKSGASQSDALDTIRGAYGKTIRLLNAQLGGYGLPQIDISQLITGKDPNKALAHFKQTLDTLIRKGMLTLERSKELEAVVEKFTLSAKTYNLDMITKGLNNELGKLKDEYELAVAIDADPEIGNAFADMMGINVESLPHTVKEYADEYSKYLNKYLKGKNSALQFTGDELRGLTRDDITAFREQVDAGSFNQEWFDAIKKAYDDIQGKRKKDINDTEKWKNSLIEKYGNLQDKLTKIYKDSVQNQVNAVKTFGTEDQKSDIVRLQLRLEATSDPAELTEINTEIAKIVKDVTDKNPIALKLVTASGNQTKADASKAYWEDFKNSELYAMTFEDMANNSTRAIQLIMDKLDGLKDKVKEDPASMKALIKSLEDAQKELNARDPFGGVARSLRDMANASQEARKAQETLWRAEVDIEKAQQEVDNAEDGTPEEQASAQQKLADAIQRRTTAQVKLTQAENKGKKAQENLKSSLQGISNQLGNVKELFDVVSKLFRAGGDDETADAIDAISEGFSIMTTVIMGVVAAMILLEASQPWLLAIAAALSVIVGLVSFLSGNENKKIDAKIKDSELAVKKLELAYIDLQKAVDKAYGTNVIGAKTAAAAAKKLELQELERQLRLERSRDSKYKDESRIVELQKQIKELRYEIQDTYTEIVNDLMGTDVGSFAENLVSAMVDAFKQGEDAMKVFNDKFDELIDNMIMKSLASRIVSSYIDKLWEEQEQKIKLRSTKEADELAKAQTEYDKVKNMSEMEWLRYHYGTDKTMSLLARAMEESGLSGEELAEYLKNLYEHRLDAVETMVQNAQQTFGDATSWTNQDINEFVSGIENIKEGLYDKLYNAISQWYTFGEDSDKNLSNLQQGLQSMSEDTANSLEAYMNGVSQQVYAQTEYLRQIAEVITRDDNPNNDVKVASLSQILLQLQSSYQVQSSIQGILEGVLNASGRAFTVELVS